MSLQINKQSAQAWVEIISGRLRQYVNDLPQSKMLTVNDLAERVTLCLLHELCDSSLLDEQPDAQFVIGVCVAINHACMQALAVSAELPPKPLNIPKEMVN